MILATGSNPVVLPLPGKDLPGVVSYRDIADVDRMIAASREFKHAVVIGGGLLGLEAAYGLQKRGMDVTVVHLVPTLDGAPARRRGRRALEALARGARAQVRDAGADGRDRGRRTACAAVRFADGSEVPADLVVMAVGIRPNVALAKASGIACERGVLVNDTMQTYDPRIYALGECVQHRGACYGLVAPLFEQAKVVANHLAEFGIGRYAGSQTSTKLKVTGIDLFSAGDFTGGAGHRGARVQGRRARRLQEDRRARATRSRAPCSTATPSTARGTSSSCATARRSTTSARTLLFGQAHLGDSGHGGAGAVTQLARQGRDLRLQRRLQGRHRQGHHEEEPVHARRGSRAHQSVLLLRLVHGPRRAAPRQHPRRRLLGSAGEEADVPVHDLHARGGARERSCASG